MGSAQGSGDHSSGLAERPTDPNAEHDGRDPRTRMHTDLYAHVSKSSVTPRAGDSDDGANPVLQEWMENIGDKATWLRGSV